MDVYGICPACKAVISFADDGKRYNCIACEKKPVLLLTTELFKMCGTIDEGLLKVKMMELLVALQDGISKDLGKQEEGNANV